MIKREAVFALKPGSSVDDENAFILPAEPEGVVFRWGWDQLKPANPKDYIDQVERMFNLGLDCPSWWHDRNGTSEDACLESISKTNKKREAKKLDPIKLSGNGASQPKTDEKETDKNKETETAITETA